MDFKSDDDELMDQNQEFQQEDHSHFDNQRLKLIAEISEVGYLLLIITSLPLRRIKYDQINHYVIDWF